VFAAAGPACREKHWVLTLSSLPAQLTKDEGLELYKDMYLGRAFEDMCAQVRDRLPARRDGPRHEEP